MFLLANLLVAVAKILEIILRVYMWIVIARAFTSWINADPYNPIVRFLCSATDPVLYRVRRALPFFPGGADISPIFVIIAIVFLQLFLVQSLMDLARSLRFMG